MASMLGEPMRERNPADVPLRVEPDLGGDQGQQDMRGRTQSLDADALPFQIGEGANAVAGKQFQAADMEAGQQRDRLPGIDRLDEVRRVIHVEINRAARDGLRQASRYPHNQSQRR